MTYEGLTYLGRAFESVILLISKETTDFTNFSSRGTSTLLDLLMHMLSVYETQEVSDVSLNYYIQVGTMIEIFLLPPSRIYPVVLK